MISNFITSIFSGIIANYLTSIIPEFFKNNKTANITNEAKNNDQKILSFLNFKKYLRRYNKRKKHKLFWELKQTNLFFSSRFSSAFPGCRDMEIIDNPTVAIHRLNVLLGKPLKASNEKYHVTPVWWYRGTDTMEIRAYEQLKWSVKGAPEFLLNNVEHHKIKRIIAFHHASYFRKFIYVEVEGMAPTGLYQNRETNEKSFYTEEYGEYGILKNKHITRDEYDDGATIINGKVIDIKNKVNLRLRVIGKYNFLIAPHESPINNPDADLLLEDILDRILSNNAELTELSNLIFNLPRLPSEEHYD